MSPDRPRRFPTAKIAAAALGIGVAVGLTAEAPVREASPTTAAERVVAAGTHRLGPAGDSIRPRPADETTGPGARAGAVPRGDDGGDDATPGASSTPAAGARDDGAKERRDHHAVTSFARRQWHRLRALER